MILTLFLKFLNDLWMQRAELHDGRMAVFVSGPKLVVTWKARSGPRESEAAQAVSVLKPGGK